MAIDTERLLKDLRAGAASALAGDDPITPIEWGMARAWLIMASAIEDGDYNLNPKTRPVEVVPGLYDSDDLDRIAAKRDREDT